MYLVEVLDIGYNLGHLKFMTFRDNSDEIEEIIHSDTNFDAP